MTDTTPIEATSPTNTPTKVVQFEGTKSNATVETPAIAAAAVTPVVPRKKDKAPFTGFRTTPASKPASKITTDEQRFRRAENKLVDLDDQTRAMLESQPKSTKRAFLVLSDKLFEHSTVTRTKKARAARLAVESYIPKSIDFHAILTCSSGLKDNATVRDLQDNFAATIVDAAISLKKDIVTLHTLETTHAFKIRRLCFLTESVTVLSMLVHRNLMGTSFKDLNYEHLGALTLKELFTDKEFMTKVNRYIISSPTALTEELGALNENTKITTATVLPLFPNYVTSAKKKALSIFKSLLGPLTYDLQVSHVEARVAKQHDREFEEAYKIKAQNAGTEATAKALADQPVIPSATMKKLITAETETSEAKAMKNQNKKTIPEPSKKRQGLLETLHQVERSESNPRSDQTPSTRRMQRTLAKV